MQIKSNSVKEYLQNIPEEKKEAMESLRKAILDNLADGFVEEMSYGMIGYVVPHTIYPDGYHCNPSLPLPFISIACQKNFIALYHMGIYADNKLLEWWKKEYSNYSKLKLDMGKSCIRFKKIDQIPYDLIGKLCQKMSVNDWIKLYENNIKLKK